MDALLKIPFIILLLVACMQAYPAGNEEMDRPDSSPFNGKTGEKVGSDSLTEEGKTDENVGSDSHNEKDHVGDKMFMNPGLFEGDILPFEPKAANTVPIPEQLWPDGQIPYTIEPELKDQEPLIKEAMKHYEDTSCIRFVPQTDQTQYVRIFKGDGCFADVGKSQSASKLSLGSGCHILQAILHELGHTLGISHEHSRSDRDDYLNIHYENIEEGEKYNFQLLNPDENQLLTPFDFDSIMLYGEKLFSKNNLKTMTAKDGRRIKDVEEKPGLSKYDIERVNKLYKC